MGDFVKPLVKICGTTSLADAELAVEAGADYVGFIVNHPPSPRNIGLDKVAEIAAQIRVPVVAVTVNKALAELEEIHRTLSAVAKEVVLQLHGDEPAELVKALTEQGMRVCGVASGDETSVRNRVRALTEAGAESVLLDVRESSPTGEVIYGGTGLLGDWNVARALADEGYKIVLAGGLSPENVTRAIEVVRPWAVDVVSGVEEVKGRKDAAKVRKFVQQVKG